MAIDYESDPRYNYVEDNVYFDTQTNETVFVLDEETSAAIRDLMALDETIFEVKEEDEEYKLTDEGAKKLLGEMLQSDLTELD